mgnify:CR=1 FL=1
MFSDLTYNLDYIDAELYKLKPSIEKGDQIVSAALSIAVSDMSWSKKDDALKLVYARAMAMQKACEANPSTMAAVLNLADDVIERICSETPGIVVAANYNCPGL